LHAISAGILIASSVRPPDDERLYSVAIFLESGLASQSAPAAATVLRKRLDDRSKLWRKKAVVAL
jgi:hypothetical protein